MKKIAWLLLLLAQGSVSAFSLPTAESSIFFKTLGFRILVPNTPLTQNIINASKASYLAAAKDNKMPTSCPYFEVIVGVRNDFNSFFGNYMGTLITLERMAGYNGVIPMTFDDAVIGSSVSLYTKGSSYIASYGDNTGTSNKKYYRGGKGYMAVCSNSPQIITAKKRY